MKVQMLILSPLDKRYIKPQCQIGYATLLNTWNCGGVTLYSVFLSAVGLNLAQQTPVNNPGPMGSQKLGQKMRPVKE